MFIEGTITNASALNLRILQIYVPLRFWRVKTSP